MFGFKSSNTAPRKRLLVHEAREGGLAAALEPELASLYEIAVDVSQGHVWAGDSQLLDTGPCMSHLWAGRWGFCFSESKGSGVQCHYCRAG
jgi:hypothetical protein